MAASQPTAKQPSIAPATDTEVDLVIAEAGGDPRLAIKNLLHDLTQLALDTEVSVSRGFVRSRLLPFRLRRLGNK